MKIAFSSNAFKRIDLITAIKEISRVGYQGIEIMCDVPHAYPPLSLAEINSIKKYIRENKLEISNLNAYTVFALGDKYRPCFIEPNLAERSKRIFHTKNCIDLAAQMESPYISIEPGGILQQGIERHWALEVFRETVEELGEYAEQRGVVVLIEPEPGLIIESPRDFISFINRVKTKAIGLNFDIGHFYCTTEDLTGVIKELSPFTHHYHLEDIPVTKVHKHLIPGSGAIDFEKVLTAIAYTGYKGFLTVELYPYEKEPVVAALKAHQYLKPILEKLKSY